MTPAIRRPTFLNTILLGGPAEGKLAAAAAAGFDQIELWTSDVAGFAGGAPAVKRFLTDRRLRLTDYQVLLDFDGAPGDKRAAKRAEAIRMLDTAVAVGASTLLAPASTDRDCDRTRIAEDLAWLVDQARARGLRIAYEGMAWSTVNSGIPRSWAAVRDLNPQHAGIVVDAYHLFVTGGTVADLAGVDPRRIFLVQLSDVARPVASVDYKQVARHARLLPGQGHFPLGELVGTLDRMGYGGPIGLEVFNDDIKAQPAEVIARAAYQALLDVLKSDRSK